MGTKSSVIISRMARYKYALQRLKKLGFVKIFSDYLGETVNVTSVQVRKDFSLFGIKGNKRGGYNIDELLEQLNEVLGAETINDIIVVGTGNLGTALLNYRGFGKNNFIIRAAFDIDPAKFNEKETIPVYPMDQLEEYLAKTGIHTAILAVPEAAAQQIYDQLTNAGIKGILNFAPIQLKTNNKCMVNNVNLCVELESILYFVNHTPINEKDDLE